MNLHWGILTRYFLMRGWQKKDQRYLPSHKILLNIFKVDPCQYFSKYIPQLIYCINLTYLDSTLYNFLTKPYGISSIMLDSRCELWWQGLFQDQSSSIVLINREINFRFLYGKPYLFSKRSSNIYHGKRLSAIMS